MYSAPRPKSRSLTAPSGQLVTALLFIVAVVALAVAWSDLTPIGRGIVAAGSVVAAINYYQIGWKQLVLEEGVLRVHDRIRRVRCIPYGAVSAITYVKQTVFKLKTDSYGLVWFDANAPDIEEFISELSSRVLQTRESLDLHGDVERTIAVKPVTARQNVE